MTVDPALNDLSLSTGGAVIRSWNVSRETDRVMITCSAVGTPNPSLIYTLDGALISSNTQLSYLKLTPDGALSASSSEAANHVFTCKASNKLGEESHTFQGGITFLR